MRKYKFSEVESNTSKGAVGILLMVPGLVLGIGAIVSFLAQISDFTLLDLVIFLGFMLLLCSPGIFIWFRAFRKRNWRINLYRQGIQDKRGNKIVEARYEDLKIWQASRSRTQTGLASFASDAEAVNSYVLEFNPKHKVKITSPKFGELLQKEVQKHQAPKCFSSYMSGDDIRFGIVTINREGLSTLSRISKKEIFIPWEDVKRLEAKNGRLHVEEKKKKLFNITIPLGKVYNVLVLLNILKSSPETSRKFVDNTVWGDNFPIPSLPNLNA